ncbi:M20 family metallopeptidase [Microbacterium sp. C7(2022)]|uniref:M20 family metallopeptidase n=1 Tax=Microbacterium sp. C7(2022) TaxID=2992759 RepID=UPI00237B53AE|nr:M20 family metallopeptidase [Microbacterium sp. C7(2022)]MDE0545423.1 M20 family metallopeptidase [Microbacterium sp. C7(2022)]
MTAPVVTDSTTRARSQGRVGSTEALVDDIRTLVECESPSRDLAAVARSAEVVATVGEDLLSAAPETIVIDGCTHLRWRFDKGADSRRGDSHPTDPHRVVVLCHHDTVWPIGSLAQHPFSVEDGVMRGPGCFDMKAGLVMALHAVASLASREGVTILVTGDEEIGSHSSRALIEAEASAADAVLVLEASADGGAVKIARKGASMYRLVVHGRAAHAGLEPHKGVNASVEAAHQVLAVRALDDPAGSTTVTPTFMQSGTATNTVPAEAWFDIDVRATTVAEQERVDAALRELAPVLEGASLELQGGINRPPLEYSASAALFERATAIAQRRSEKALVGVAVGGASDGNFTAGVGTPTLDGLGAVGGGAHAVDEHVIVDTLAPRTAFLADLIEDLLAGGS